MNIPTFISLPQFTVKRKRISTPNPSIYCNLRLSGKKILVTGATGPTGRLICAALSKRGAKVRAFIRPKTYMKDRPRIDAISEICPNVQFAVGDLRDIDTITRAVKGCDGIVSASGTRNFDGIDPNRPEIVDWHGIRQLVEMFLEEQVALELKDVLSDTSDENQSTMNDTISSTTNDNDTFQDDLQATMSALANSVSSVSNPSKLVLVSSLGVTRPERFPQLEQFGSMLSYKMCGEEAVRQSGCPFTIIRPGGFKDNPAGEDSIMLDQGDRLAGTISRADVAEICAEAIFRPNATNVTFECVAQPKVSGMQLASQKGFSPGMFDNLIPECL